ncbi:LLM class flavin-dependent oxidoreductase [Streptomyces pactum]|uniref:LLM class flavin-dependent oxidoreductase n=1 Tax=Streptomyces pactum TaxID=68249 RepID=UPI0036FF8372
MPPELHLAAALDTAGHPAPPGRPSAVGRADPPAAGHWTALATLAEQGALDFVTLDDSLAPPPEGHPGRPDAVAVLARVAPDTHRIGLVPTVTTTHTEPFHVSSALATLDFVSEGRAGWLAEVSTTEAEARAIGRRPVAPPAELWAEAADAAEVAARLWDSWEDDAEIRDAATGRFIDRDRLHHIDFHGRYFSVRGPAIVPRPPQGRPPVAVVWDPAGPPARRTFAARHADIVLLAADDPDRARTALRELRDRAAAAGREPAQPRVLLRVAIALTGPDGSGHPGRPVAGRPAGAPALRHTGTPGELAGRLADWREATGADGFHLLPADPVADLGAVVRHLVPALRARGLFRTGYTGRTLRDHLGLPRPANRYTTKTVR